MISRIHLAHTLIPASQVVDETSARLNISQEVAVPLLGTNHVSICKFDDKENPNYELVLDALRQFIPNATDSRQ